jgi:homoserine dehydrogenase
MTGAEILKLIFDAAIKAGAGEVAKGAVDLAKKAWAKLKAKFAGESEVVKALESAESSKSESELANVAPFLDMERVRKSDFWNELVADVQQIQQQINTGTQTSVQQANQSFDSSKQINIGTAGNVDLSNF